MKTNKMISFTFCNGLLLLIFASMLASCQKSNIKQVGHFSQFNQYRSIASVANQKDYDPKQIFIFCSINTANVDSCYKAKMSKLKINTIKSLPAVKIEVEGITQSIIKTVSTDIQKNINTRKSFCLINSKYYLEKCLTQYIERDSLVTLNKYQKSAPGITGYEYLHLQRSIASVYSEKLDRIYKEESLKQKKSL